VKRGDIVLCKHGGTIPHLIRFFQRAQVFGWWYALTSIGRERDDIADFNHAAILSHVGADGDWLVIQAEAHGVGWGRLSTLGDVVVVDSQLDSRGRDLALSFAQRAFGYKYGWFTIASIAWNIITPRIMDFHRNGTFICSALVAQCMLAGGYPLPISIDLDQVSPAELAQVWRVRI
jgi:hypothetical protein